MIQSERLRSITRQRTTSTTPIDESTLTSPSPSTDLKITVRFQPIGSTRILSTRVFKIGRNRNISTLILFIRKQIEVQSVFLYIQSSFQPNPDENLGTLYDLYKTGEELIISYCDTVAFG
ncbi:putative autophagy protein Apg12 [Scheffersomyces coipomensis]|uniref:putative autophagy protein Apg12 n=1 Tax=Scheffersomyces coipomensis TaxID=1788519 RepID=UPI00315CA120